MYYPNFKEKYHIEQVSNEGIFLLSENEQHLLEGETLKHMVPLINGSNSYDDIIEIVSTYTGREKAIEGFNILVNNGHIIEFDNNIHPYFKPFWQELGLNYNQISNLISKTNIHIMNFGEINTNHFKFFLNSFGLLLDNNKNPSLVIAAVEDYQHPSLSFVNDYCLKYGIPWALVKISGLRPMIGPFFRPGITACWKCLETRLSHNREIETYIQKRKNLNGPFPKVKSRIPMIEAQIASIFVTQLIKWLALGKNFSLESNIISIDPLNLTQQFHTVVKRPQCVTCGNPQLAILGGKPLCIKSQIAKGREKNGNRLESAESTYWRFAHHISDTVGVIKEIVPSNWHGIGPIKTYVAGHNFALINDDLYFIKDGIRSNSSGKGRTDSEARTSALCEAIERFSGVFKSDEVEQIYKSFNELNENNEQAINPRKVMLFSEKQYLERKEWLEKNQRFQIVPLSFDENAKISWSPVWSITEEKTKYLPTSYLYYGFKDSDDKFFCWGDSNGNAAGSCLEDAILQGFLELIERDSVCIWWYNQLKRPCIDLDSLEDSYVSELKEFYIEKDREFWVLDITTDTGIPSFVAINRRTNHEKEDIIMGFGAHLDARIAINRAITEMNQFIPAVLSLDEKGNTIYYYSDPAAINWWQTATIKNQPYLMPVGSKLKIKDLPSCSNKDIKVQLDQCFKITKNLNMEVLVLNQTKPDIGLPVVKVIVPGLRHFWARFAPGRLYEVPQKMGWLSSAKVEQDLNPICMFL